METAEEGAVAEGPSGGDDSQAFGHLGSIHAAARLDRALWLCVDGIEEPPRLRFDSPHAA